MKKISIFITVIAVLCISCTTCFAKDIKGNGKLITKSIPISNFSKVVVRTPVEINYSQGKNTGNIEFTVDNNLLDYYDIFTEGEVLNIKIKDKYKSEYHDLIKGGYRQEFCELKPTKCLITVSSEQLQSVEIKGNSTFNFCSAFTSNELTMELLGQGKILANKYPMHIEDCKIRIRGSGNMQLSGTIQQTDIEITGRGKLKALNCEITKLNSRIRGSGNAQFSGTIQQADVDITGSGQVKALDCKIAKLCSSIRGSGDMKVYISDILNVKIVGSGKVKYKGNPDITSNIVGSGRVVKL
jgi:hypothetical protein